MASFDKVLTKVFGSSNERFLKTVRPMIAQINEFEPAVKQLTDEQLREKTLEYKARIADAVKDARDKDDRKYREQQVLNDILPEAFAVVREASVRTTGMRHFDVQMIGGLVLHQGKIAEMRTGEGKTLVATLPSYLNALTGRGVHVITVNDYLASRDAEWMGQIHRFLGLEVGCIQNDMDDFERQTAYNADITYGTNNEFGFDYLRDNMKFDLATCVQRGHYHAVVDEVDSILIDEARTPLIISGPSEESTDKYYQANAIIPQLVRGEELEEGKKTGDYVVDEKNHSAVLTEDGVDKAERLLGVGNLYDPDNMELLHCVEQALKAHTLYRLDHQYVVQDGEVIIVDDFTGRLMKGRRWSDGLHQAVEAKEGVKIERENQTLATITLQNYFRLYEKLSGMTGTAETEAAEFHQTYKLGVVPIPTNRPMVRADQPDLIYKTEEAKYEAVAEDIAERHEKGQPVLVGTTSVEKSERLSKLLVKLSVPHEVLNAKHHDREALIVARAGQKGAVTVATNMAGRGTDIVLGGNPDLIADQVLRERGLDPVEHSEEYEAAWPEVLEQVKAESKAEAEEVRDAGGLYVLGTERHESRRIDNQLRGRSGRQGDPGESRFYLSLGDELMRRFNATMVERVMTTMRLPDDVPIEHKMVSKAIKSAQTQVEQINMEQRKDVLKYDEVMNEQRKVIYAERHRVLAGENLRDQIEGMLVDVVNAYVDGATANGYAEDWDHEKLWTALKTLYPVSIEWDDLMEDGDLDAQGLRDALVQDARNAYDKREAEINALVGPDGMRTLEHQVMLTVLDRKWREHLSERAPHKQGT